MRDLKSDLEKEQQEAARQQTEAREQAAVWSCLRQNPSRNLDANISLLIGYIRPLEVNEQNLTKAAAAIESQLATIDPQRGQERIGREDAEAAARVKAEAEAVKQNAAEAHAALVARYRGMSAGELRETIRMEQAVKQISEPVVVPHSRRDLIRMSGAQMRLLLYTKSGEKRPGVEAEVNRILAGG